MLALIVKHLLANEYGPLDRILEIGIFLFVFAELLLTVVGLWKGRKRERRWRKRSDLIFASLTKGHELLLGAPPRRPSELENVESAEAWSKVVFDWVLDTQKLLQGFSPLAVAAFMDDCVVGSPNRSCRLRQSAFSDYSTSSK